MNPRPSLPSGKTPDAANRTMEQTQLDRVDKRLLDIIQTAFPLVSHPYAALGEQLGISEEDALNRVRRMKKIGLIRRMGANFQSAKLGFRSTLCAARVPEEQLESFVAEVNSHPGVTHNYLRNHAYNVWFTLIGPSWEEVCATLEEITRRTGIALLNLPAARLYKIRVDFQMEE